ncbi:dihydrofolate reductase family protein [uncultured Cellulomonas sp.]|uniref:dihydrofolate reductase family protein n=1 Tax=uncultured Cellulomonas sp. TaxID=189682 RepID=UPI0026227A70|nr:dihydrofolate reductase family protein [uncultured Cellulomonas sp.]
MHPAPGPVLDVLLPVGSPRPRVEVEPGEPVLTELYAHPAPAGAGAWVRANMIGTLDGAATGSDGRSGSINGPADHRVFAVLRSLADVVLVGAGTVRAEGYGELPVRDDLRRARADRGQRPELELAVVTRSGALPDHLLDAGRPPWVLTVEDRPDLDALRRRVGAERVLAAGVGDVDLAAALRLLAARGLPRVLTEGGPRLLGDLLAAGLVDDLCLTTTPCLVGGTARRVVDRDDWLAPPETARCAHLLHSDGVLLGRWLLTAPGARAVEPRTLD